MSDERRAARRARASNFTPPFVPVIGDEILKAQVRDTNSHYICTLLYRCGVKAKKISVVADDVEDIAREIRDFASKFTYVVTSGGIGPTHDDVTYEGLARAFDDRLHYHPTLVNILKTKFGFRDLSSPGYKMAYIPTKATLGFGKDRATGEALPYPCIVMRNVYVFPGSPLYLEKSFRALHEELFSTNKSFSRTEVYVNAREESFADVLSTVAKECPSVAIGSYPVNDQRHYKVRVTMESDSESDTENARKRFCDLLPLNVLVNIDRAPSIDYTVEYEKFLLHCRHARIYKDSLDKFLSIYEKPEEVAVLYDGSVESVIAIHLSHIASTRLRSQRRLEIVRLGSSISSTTGGYRISELTERYPLNIHTAHYESDMDRTIEHLLLQRPELRILLVGKRSIQCGEDASICDLEGVRKINKVEVTCPLEKWTSEDISVFARSLLLHLHPDTVE